MKVYATRFEFDAKVGLMPLAIATQRWLADARRFGRGISDMDILQPWQGKAEGRDGCDATIDAFEAGGTNLWACRFSHADRDHADRRWTTHIGARLTEQGGVCSVFLDLESTGHAVTMQRFTTSRPEIVINLLEAVGEDSLHDIPTGVRTVRSRQLEEFIKFIRDPDRKLPVILATTSLQSERPLIAPARLGSLLAAMAYVYQFDDKFTGMDFSKGIGNEWSVWDGAVRIYWPINADNNTPYRHRRWMPWHIEELRRIGEAEGGIFRYVCRNACMIPTQLLIAVDDVVRLRTRAKLETLAKSTEQTKEWQEAVQLYDVVLKEKDGEIAERDAQLRLAATSEAALREKLEGLRNENRTLKQNLKTVYEHKDEPLPDVARDSIADVMEVCSSVGEIVEWVADEYKDRLFFLPAALKDAKNSKFERLEECVAALQILATVYWSMRADRGATLDDFKEAIADHGIQYSPKISQVTAGRYGQEYERRYRNRKADMNNHLKIGDDRDPRYTMRIHFEWDEDDKLVVVNYCGWHTKTGH